VSYLENPIDEQSAALRIEVETLKESLGAKDSELAAAGEEAASRKEQIERSIQLVCDSYEGSACGAC
jgi:regulator of replication initiation timing